MTRRQVSFAFFAYAWTVAALAADPLPSWKDTATKQAIVAFVDKVTLQGGSNFVPTEQRIAVFDMDGTLITEKPVPAAALPIVGDIKRAVGRRPELKKKPAIAALLRADLAGVAATGEAGQADIVAAAIDNRTEEEVAADMARVQSSAKNPRYGKPYTELTYVPMIELLTYLRANGFQTWISSGTPVAYTRGLSAAQFGIPPQQVIGSSLKTKFSERDGRSVLVYTGEVDHVNDKEGKPPGINLAIGARPIFVGGNVGNSGDIAMMRYSKDRQGPSFQLLINHDDGTREFAYAEKDGYSLSSAKHYGFNVVSMRDDWATIFSTLPEAKTPGQ